MKKIILFCLSACLLGMLMLGCPNTGTGEQTPTSTTTTISYTAEPGTLEQGSEYLSVMVAAKESMTILDDEVVFFYYRPDGKYSDWSLWMWPTGGDGAENWDIITNKGYSVKSVSYKGATKKVGYMKFNNEGTDANGCIPLVGKSLDVIKNHGVFNFIVRKKSDEWIKDFPDDLKWNTALSSCFGTVSTEGIVYEVSANAKPLLIDASMTKSDTIVILLLLSVKLNTIQISCLSDCVYN